jgi:hypothetical protein
MPRAFLSHTGVPRMFRGFFRSESLYVHSVTASCGTSRVFDDFHTFPEPTRNRYSQDNRREIEVIALMNDAGLIKLWKL